MLAHRYPLLYNLISTAPNPHSFESIFASIQDLLARDDLSVTNVFRRFAVLSIRYEDARSPEKVESWDGQLSSEFTFLDEISSAPPLVIVNSMTDRHSALFAALKEDDYPSSDRLQFITDTWDRLSKNIKECALADHALVNKLARIEIVSFWFSRLLLSAHWYLGLFASPKLFRWLCDSSCSGKCGDPPQKDAAL